MRIYVTSKWTDRSNIQDVQAQLQAAGHTITHDWTRVEGINLRPTMTEEERVAHKAASAKLDIDGVCTADAVLAIMDDPAYQYRGTFTEIGCGLGAGKEVIIVCPAPSDTMAASNCFCHHPRIVHYKRVDEAMQHLLTR